MFLNFFIECDIQENGLRSSTRKRPNESDSQKEEDVNKKQNSIHHGYQRLRCRRANVAVNKLKFDVEELSNSKTRDIANRNGKLNHHIVPSTIRARSDSSADGSQQSDKDENGHNSRRKYTLSSSSDVPARIYDSDSENSSNSESAATNNRHIKVRRHKHRTASDKSSSIKPRMEVSEGSPKSHISKDKSHDSFSAVDTIVDSESQGESKLDQYSEETRKWNTYQKTATTSNKSDPQNHIKPTTETDVKQREDGIGSVCHSKGSSRRLKSRCTADTSCPSDLENEANSNSNNYSEDTIEHKKKKRKTEVTKKELTSQEMSQSPVVLRDRKNYKYYAEHSSEAMTVKSLNEQKIPRRSAAVAASKIKLISDAREELSSSEVGYTANKNRKLPYRNASAAARKLLDESPTPSESESELKECKMEEEQFETGRKPSKELETKHLDSKKESGMKQKGKRSSGPRRRFFGTVSRMYPKHKKLVEFSEEESFSSVTSEEQRDLNHSLSPDNHNAKINSAGDSESENVCMIKAVRSTTERVEGEQRKGRRALSKSQKSEASRSSKSELECFSNLSSDLEPQTELKKNSKVRKTKKRKRKAIPVGKTVSDVFSESPRTLQRRKRPKVNEENDSEELDYTKYQRVNRRSKIRTRNGGRRTVRYADDEDDCEM
ncbi:hypothetical protein JD844_032665 [Phrynosoma platyrhinos]|uniref:Shugoshin C-terminal domain-containing protein n=1 Tax=Phrynosoma platyrhinos TaxID=52577 RepID=A0ABQ7T5G0_PHRPL|nr:hypothetical protein JD844_032665 [Phrynosoma platyrhinos]